MSKYVIIVPAYNCEAYVEETLHSLMAQGDALLRVDRIILTDDCSTDRTIEVAKATWKGPIPLEVYDTPKNRGEYKNMNECIARLPSHIEWYLVMHADNLAKAGWLKTLLDAADEADSKGEHVGTIFTSWDNLFEDGSIVEGENRKPYAPEVIKGNAANVADTIRRGCWWHISSCVTRVAMYREIGGLPMGLRLKGDWDFMMRLLGAGWDIVYLPLALMTYRMNPTGSSSISFRRHRDVYETLTVMQRHQMTMTTWDSVAYHLAQWKTLFRRAVGGVFRGEFERAFATIPMGVFVLGSLVKCLRRRWLGRRYFDWVSSVDPVNESRLYQLSSRMGSFYSLPSTRDAYQAMVDDEASAQPVTEGELRKAILAGGPSKVLEVGCGSGRIYERLKQAGMTAAFTGVEMSPKVIAANQQRFPEASWHCGSGYALPAGIGKFDRVYAYYVLEHTAFPQRFLTSLLAAVAPGGKLLLTYPDMAEAGVFGSQALGLDTDSAKAHLQSGRILHALVRLWDSRVRLPRALASISSGTFPVNLQPQCLEPGIRIEPDVDAIYAATRKEVSEWAQAQGCSVSFPGGNDRILQTNVLIQIQRPAL